MAVRNSSCVSDVCMSMTKVNVTSWLCVISQLLTADEWK